MAGIKNAVAVPYQPLQGVKKGGAVPPVVDNFIQQDGSDFVQQDGSSLFLTN